MTCNLLSILFFSIFSRLKKNSFIIHSSRKYISTLKSIAKRITFTYLLNIINQVLFSIYTHIRTIWLLQSLTNVNFFETMEALLRLWFSIQLYYSNILLHTIYIYNIYLIPSINLNSVIRRLFFIFFRSTCQYTIVFW